MTTIFLTRAAVTVTVPMIHATPQQSLKAYYTLHRQTLMGMIETLRVPAIILSCAGINYPALTADAITLQSLVVDLI